jgi:hypothetical protein
VIRSVQDNWLAQIRDLCGLHLCGDTQQGFRFRIGRLENEAREISRKMNDVLTRAARDFEDETRHRKDIAKDIENEIAISVRSQARTGGDRSSSSHIQLGFGPAYAGRFVAEVFAIRFGASTAQPPRRIIVATTRPFGA